MVEILPLSSPHKLLKNLGALSKYAKCSQSSGYPGYDGIVKKSISPYFPFKEGREVTFTR